MQGIPGGKYRPEKKSPLGQYWEILKKTNKQTKKKRTPLNGYFFPIKKRTVKVKITRPALNSKALLIKLHKHQTSFYSKRN